MSIYADWLNELAAWLDDCPPEVRAVFPRSVAGASDARETAKHIIALESRLDAYQSCEKCGTSWRSEHEVSQYDCPHCGIMEAMEQFQTLQQAFMQVEYRLGALQKEHEALIHDHERVKECENEYLNQLLECELSLSVFDPGGSSEYWLRHHSPHEPVDEVRARIKANAVETRSNNSDG